MGVLQIIELLARYARTPEGERPELAPRLRVAGTYLRELAERLEGAEGRVRVPPEPVVAPVVAVVPEPVPEPEPEPEPTPEPEPVAVADPRLEGGEDPGKAVGTRGPVTLQTAAAAVAAIGEAFTRRDFADAVGLKPIAAGRWIGQLVERGVIRDAPDGFVYVPPPADAVPLPTPKPEEAAEVEDKPKPKPKPKPITVGEAQALKKVRDFVAKQKPGVMFSPAQAQEATDMPREAVLACLAALAKRGIVSDESPSLDMPLFAYVAPKDPGKAAELDAKRRKAASKEQARSAGGGPIAGTGKGLTVTNADVRGLVNAATAAGADVTHATNGHFCVTFKNEAGENKRVLIAATPRGTRTVMNDRARLRKAGLAV